MRKSPARPPLSDASTIRRSHSSALPSAPARLCCGVSSPQPSPPPLHQSYQQWEAFVVTTTMRTTHSSSTLDSSCCSRRPLRPTSEPMRRASRVAAEEGRRPSPLPGCSEAAIKLYQRVGISRHDAGPGVSCVIARRQPAGCNALLGLGASPQVPTPRLLRGPGAGRRHGCERDAEVHFPVLCRAHRQGALRGHVGRRPAVVLYGAVPSKPALGTSQTPPRRRSLSL